MHAWLLKTTTLLWTFSFKWHEVLKAHDRPFRVSQISHEATKFAVYLQLSSSVSKYFTVMILWINGFWKEAFKPAEKTKKKKHLNGVVLMKPVRLSAYSTVYQFWVFVTSDPLNQHLWLSAFTWTLCEHHVLFFASDTILTHQLCFIAYVLCYCIECFCIASEDTVLYNASHWLMSPQMAVGSHLRCYI